MLTNVVHIFLQIRLTDAIFEEQLRYLPSGELTLSWRALPRVSPLLVSPRNFSSFDAPESFKPHIVVGNNSLDKIHQLRKSFGLCRRFY